ncbi:MAG: GAF domain-containing protein, partial [Myxococcaceae bacterium]
MFALLHLARGGFHGLEHLSWWEAYVVLALLVGLGAATGRRLRRSDTRVRDDLELGSTLVAMAYVVVAVGGGPLLPVVYLLIACLVSFLPRSAAMTLVGVAMVFDAVLSLRVPEPSFLTLTGHSVFLIAFAATYHLVLSARLAAARRAENAAVKNRIKEVEERARTFRLVHSGTQDSSPGLKDQEKWLVASVKEIEGAVGAALEIAEIALGTHTCAAFLLSSDDRALKLYDCRSASDRVQRDRISAGEGILGGVLKRSVPIRMHAANGLKGVSYYEGGAEISALLAVPIIEGGGLMRGVLVADRLKPVPFTEQDERLLQTISAEVLRSIEVERVMNYIRQTRD